MKVVFPAGGDGYHAQLARGVEAAGIPLVRVAPDDRDALRRELADADAVVCNRLVPEDTAAATALRLVQATSAGADAIDPAALPPGCPLCNLGGHEQAIAEWALMAVLAVTRHLLAYDRRFRAGEWGLGLPLERELAGRTLGAVGYGRINRRVAELAGAFGMTAAAVTRSPSPDRAAGLARLDGLDELPRLLEEADVAVVALPLAEETRGLVGAAELDRLGPDGVLVNVGRGEVVDEEALYQALEAGRIAGAALDVWYRYPAGLERRGAPSRFPFHELDNVVMTPHVSGRTVGTRERRAAFVAEQLRRLADGRPLANVLAVGGRR